MHSLGTKGDLPPFFKGGRPRRESPSASAEEALFMAPAAGHTLLEAKSAPWAGSSRPRMGFPRKSLAEVPLDLRSLVKVSLARSTWVPSSWLVSGSPGSSAALFMASAVKVTRAGFFGQTQLGLFSLSSSSVFVFVSGSNFASWPFLPHLGGAHRALAAAVPLRQPCHCGSPLCTASVA